MNRFMSAYQVGETTGKHGECKYAYGIDRAKTVAFLRDLADAIEKHDILPQELIVTTKAASSDFCITNLAMTFAESEQITLTQKVQQ